MSPLARVLPPVPRRALAVGRDRRHGPGAGLDRAGGDGLHPARVQEDFQPRGACSWLPWRWWCSAAGGPPEIGGGSGAVCGHGPAARDAQRAGSTQGWRALPARRLEVAGELEEPFPLQWACDEADPHGSPRRAGGRPLPGRRGARWSGWCRWRVGRSCRSCRDTTGATRHTWTSCDGTRNAEEREVLRLWRSDVQVGAGFRAASLPVWYGAVYRHTRCTRRALSRSRRPASGLSPTAFAAELPSDVRRQEQSREPGQAKIRSWLCASRRRPGSTCGLPATGWGEAGWRTPPRRHLAMPEGCSGLQICR